MKKTFIATRRVRDFIGTQPPECRAEYLTLVRRLEEDGFLVEPFAKKLGKDLFEIRVRRGRQVRVLYFYHAGDVVFGVHAFVKKTQKTPPGKIRLARKTIGMIRKGTYRDEQETD